MLLADIRTAQIGTVVEGQGTGASKKTYNGQEYDFVFDIDIEEGKNFSMAEIKAQMIEVLEIIQEEL